MDYSSDDSVDDPNYNPSSDEETMSDSESDIPLSRFRYQTSPIIEDSTPSTSGSTNQTEVEIVNQKIRSMEWTNCGIDDPPNHEYTAEYISGMKTIYKDIFARASPLEYFEMFLTNDILELIVDQTNLFATQYLLNNDISRGSRTHAWTPVDKAEIYRFLALIGWMGLVKLPAIRDYWRSDNLYSVPLAKTIMPRNKFELILKFIHFSDNEDLENGQDRLYKLRNVMNKFIYNYQQVYTPGQKVCIDESLIPWRGRLIFKQYIPNKRHKYGIKVFKLCSDKGYTWNLMVYCGKMQNAETDVAQNVVMDLMDGLLDQGRVLYTDNWYTSIPLAYRLQNRKTHLVGTLRLNRKHLPQDVVAAKLRKGEIAAKETRDGVVVLKWRDKRVVSALSTKHSALKTVRSTSSRGVTLKPQCIVDYNTGKSSIDLSDQMASYSSALRRCTKWYRKLFFEILWGTSIVNAYHLYCINSVNKQVSITKFREEVIREMLQKFPRPSIQISRLQANSPSTSRRNTHKLIIKTIGSPPRKTKGRCVECYKVYGKKGKIVDGKRVFAKQTQRICSVCNLFFCPDCFNDTH